MTAPLQFELFPENKSPLFGMQVKFDGSRRCPRCHSIVATVARTIGPHYAELKCANCGTGCGWLSKSTAAWLESVISKFGCPAEPIILRRWT